MTVYLEHQWDPQRGTVTLVATTGFGSSGDRHAVTVPAATAADASSKWRDWVGMYRSTGAEVVL